MIVYGVISSKTEEAVELFVRREDAEVVVAKWKRDGPDDDTRTNYDSLSDVATTPDA
jgi:hypothetical protein